MSRFYFCALAIFISSFANASTTCGEGQVASARFNWCATGTSTRTAIYYLHGNGESETSWPRAEHQSLVEQWSSEDPRVISVSFGPTWFFTRDLAQKFTTQIIPWLEQTLQIQPDTRLLFGESMGGFNALQLYLHAPASFARVAAACPALLPFPPQVGSLQVDAFIERHRPYIIPRLVTKWLEKLRSAYPRPSDWAAHDPLGLAASLPKTQPPLFMYSNGLDVFGFQEATASLAKMLKAAPVRIDYRHAAGTQHCLPGGDVTQALGSFLITN